MSKKNLLLWMFFILLWFLFSQLLNVINGAKNYVTNANTEINLWYSTPILEQFKFQWRLYNAFQIPKWKIDYYKKHNVWYDDFIIMSVINNLECGREDWACDSWSDVWPFQLNFIHTDGFAHWRKLIKEEKWWELFETQMLWTYNRMKRMDNSFCGKKPDLRSRLKCQLVMHNWNDKNWFKYTYADKWEMIFDILNKYSIEESYNLVTEWSDLYKYLPFQENSELIIQNIKLFNENQELKEKLTENKYKEYCSKTYVTWWKKTYCDMAEVLLPKPEFKIRRFNYITNQYEEEIITTENILKKELEENVKSVDLTWNEQTLSTQEIKKEVEKQRISSIIVKEQEKRRDILEDLFYNWFFGNKEFVEKLRKEMIVLKNNWIITEAELEETLKALKNVIDNNNYNSIELLKEIIAQNTRDIKILEEYFSKVEKKGVDFSSVKETAEKQNKLQWIISDIYLDRDSIMKEVIKYNEWTNTTDNSWN